MPSTNKPPCSCLRCGMAATYCLCSVKPVLPSQAAGCLLSHRRETAKFKNTGKLVQQCLPHFAREVWQRKQTLACLAQAKLLSRQPVLVFPAEDNTQITIDANAEQYWLVIDSTWQQANKIVRQTPSLQHLPRVAVDAGYSSQYRLRRNQTEGGLATVEVVAALLKQVGETAQSQQLMRYFLAFMAAYERQRNDPSIANS